MSENDYFSKLEEALASVVNGLAISGLNVYTGMDDEDMRLPRCVVMAVSMGEEEIKGTGVVPITADVMVVTSDDDEGLSTHRDRVAQIFGAILDDGIAATLSAAVSDFHVYELDQVGRSSDPENRKLRETLSVEVVCCGIDLV